jgi:PBP superfamily domain
MWGFVMNDDFLHRPRKAPPPEFLADLKARLDRQPKILAARRRSGFVRGMLIGFLVAGVSFALASVSLTGWPTSARQFFGAPLHYMAQFLGRGNESEQEKSPHVKAQPLGPALFPIHGNAQTASAPDTAWATATATGPGAAPGTASAGALSTSSSEAQTAAAGTGGAKQPAPQPSGTQIGVQRDIHSFMQANLRGSWIAPRLVNLPDAEIVTAMCDPVAPSPSPRPTMIATTHRITSSEPGCRLRQHPGKVMEFKLGYQAVVLARSKLYTMYLSPRMLYLALARRVPDPANPNELIDNPYTTWSSTWPGSTSTLPDDRIQVYGPALDSPQGRLAVQLLLDMGCNTFPRIAALRETNEPEFDAACRQIRTDGLYAEVPQHADLIEMLNMNPTALGVLSLQGFQAVQNRLNANPISDAAPEYAALGSQRYPLSRTLYFYMHIWSDTWPRQYFDDVLNPSFYEMRDPPWGFVPLDEAESALNRANFEARKYVQF